MYRMNTRAFCLVIFRVNDEIKIQKKKIEKNKIEWESSLCKNELKVTVIIRFIDYLYLMIVHRNDLLIFIDKSIFNDIIDFLYVYFVRHNLFFLNHWYQYDVMNFVSMNHWYSQCEMCALFVIICAQIEYIFYPAYLRGSEHTYFYLFFSSISSMFYSAPSNTCGFNANERHVNET